jgi:cyclophilin family peptidyl-prolyl cis-trans isomerase
MKRAPLLLLAAAALAGCGGGHKKAAPTNGCTDVDRPQLAARTAPKPTSPLDATKTYDVTFVTNCGSFAVRLDVRDSPHTAASFASLVRRGFFDGTIFHRIVPGFVIQGGDPTGQGTGGPGYETVDRPPASTRYTLGTVAMAKTQAEPAGTSGSQFFVVTGSGASTLPPDYAVLGRVVRGLPVVKRIGKLGDPNTEEPTRVVEIEKATLHVS